MRKILLCIAIALLSVPALSQEYKLGPKNKDGYTTIYKTIYTKGDPGSSTYYGLIDNTGKIVVPLAYRSVHTSQEPGLYIIKDTLDKAGLYSIPAGKFIVAPQYYDIERFSEALAVVKKRNESYAFSWGAVDKQGNIVIPVEYDYLGNMQEGLMNFKKNGSYGFIDKDNKIVIPATYGNIASFNSGLAPALIKESQKYGYIDKNNNLVVPAKYEEADGFYKGYAIVKRKKAINDRTGKPLTEAEVGLINSKGDEITDFSYNSISLRQDNGFFVVTKNKLKGIIDSTGKEMLSPGYKDIRTSFDGNFVYRNENGKWGMISPTGTIILKPEYDFISDSSYGKLYISKAGKATVIDKKMKVIIPADSAERVLIQPGRILYVSTDKVKVYDHYGKQLKVISQPNIKTWDIGITAGQDSIKINYESIVKLINLSTGVVKTMPFNESSDFNEEGVFLARKIRHSFFDHTGRLLSKDKYYTAVNFSQGVCALQTADSSPIYLADRNFNKIKDIQYNFKGPYSEGLGQATDKNGSIVYLDRLGNVVFTIDAKEAGECINGRIAVRDRYDQYYYVDKKGKKIGTKAWSGMGDFSEGLAAVGEFGKWGFMDSLGKLVIPLQFDMVSSFSKGIAIAKMGTKYLLIKKNGTNLDNNSYDAAGNPANGTFPLMKGSLAGLVDSTGRTIIDFKYQSITAMSEERSWAMKEGKWGLIDSKGNELGAFIYKSAGSFKNGYAKVNINDKLGMVDKSGKLVVPVEYKEIGTVYKNMLIAILPAGMTTYSLR